MTTPLFDTPKAKTLRATSLSVKGVKGIDETKVELGEHYTLFVGKNGIGKSSMLDAARNVILGSAALASIARVVDGEPCEPEVVVVLKSEDGEEKRITKTAEKTPVIKSRIGNSAAFETVKRPGDYLRTISDQGADPARFLTSPPKEQVEMLLGALKLEWDQAAVDRILGGFKALVVAENLPLEHLHPLQRVQAIRDSIFRARTGVNRDEKAKRAAADQTLRDAPAEIPQGVGERIAEKRAEIAGRQSALSSQKEAWQGKYRASEKAAETKRDAAIAAANAAFNAEIAKAKGEAEAEKALLSADQGALDAANAELSTLLRDQTDATRAATMHETAAKFLCDAESFKDTADRMTATIEALDSFKAEMASDIPIEGLTIGDGGIMIGGVPLAQINTASRVAVAFSIATLRLKGLALRVLFLDNLESLDEEHRSVLFALAKQHGVYIMGAQVTAEETLTVVRG